jgi:hypothetical protein
VAAFLLLACSPPSEETGSVPDALPAPMFADWADPLVAADPADATGPDLPALPATADLAAEAPQPYAGVGVTVRPAAGEATLPVRVHLAEAEPLPSPEEERHFCLPRGEGTYLLRVESVAAGRYALEVRRDDFLSTMI